MTSVGYGDISPVTYIEHIFVIVINFISCGVFAYFINNIGRIVDALFGDGEKFRI